MLICNLSKLESVLDQVKTSHDNLEIQDAALVASAIMASGREAIAIFDENQFVWPDQSEALTAAILKEVELIQQTVEPAPKKTSKSAPEDEPVQITVRLTPSIEAGEKVLQGKNNLKALFSQIIQTGVEYQVSQSYDIGWQWTLDRTNWNTQSGKQLLRKVKIKTEFEGNNIATDLAVSSKKGKKKAAE